MKNKKHCKLTHIIFKSMPSMPGVTTYEWEQLKKMQALGKGFFCFWLIFFFFLQLIKHKSEQQLKKSYFNNSRKYALEIVTSMHSTVYYQKAIYFLPLRMHAWGVHGVRCRRHSHLKFELTSKGNNINMHTGEFCRSNSWME